MDDFSDSFSSKIMHTIEYHLHACLPNLETWVDHNGFKLSLTKTVCMHFGRFCGVRHHPALTLLNSLVPIVPTFEFLSLTLNSKYLFISHVQLPTNSCKRALDILRALANINFGSASIIYGAARPLRG